MDHVGHVPRSRRENVRGVGQGDNDAVELGAAALSKATGEQVGIGVAPVAMRRALIGLVELVHLGRAWRWRSGHVDGDLVHHGDAGPVAHVGQGAVNVGQSHDHEVDAIGLDCARRCGNDATQVRIVRVRVAKRIAIDVRVVLIWVH